MKSVSHIEINLDLVEEGLRLWIDARTPESLFDAGDSAEENNEARFQLVEGCFYDFQLNYSEFVLGDLGENIIQPHKRNAHLGTIAPNIFVGTLSIPLLRRESSQQCCRIDLEVQSIKAGYRDDYRDMLEFITEKCTDLLLQANSPVSQPVEIDYTKDSQTLYQKFSFIKSIVGTTEFAESIHRVVMSPVTKWTEISEGRDIRSVRRLSNSNTKEILKGGKRTKLPDSHFLKNYGIETLPERITTVRKTDSVDTPENRFVKHALEAFLKLCSEINSKAKEFGRKNILMESELLVQQLESQLDHAVFKDVSRPTTLKLNSPVLQRKEGYREILRVWLLFDLAAKLIWKGGDDVYSGGKKDIATLYEYWLFFKLLELCQSIFEIDAKDVSDLISETDDGLGVEIRQGKFTALCGVYDSGSRKLNVRFNYNRSFSGRKSYPDSGSWTTTLRPDYTLSFWPFGISEADAEKQELIVHVHFDAKYRIASLADFLEQNTENDLDKEKRENRKGIYKNADLLKMHAYKDAIRRTGGAYVLYPGDKSVNQKGFHEIIPGLGAFAVRPSKYDNGIGDLREFILAVIEHFINRASQREKIAFRTFEIFKEPPGLDSVVKEQLPEAINSNRSLIPDETYVLVGYYNTAQQYDWIKTNGLYNFRMGSGSGSLILDSATISARFLLLHTAGDAFSTDLWRIVSKGPKVYSKSDLVKRGYPSASQDYYLVVSIEPVMDPELLNVKWRFKELANYRSGNLSAFPFTTTLAELSRYVVR